MQLSAVWVHKQEFMGASHYASSHMLFIHAYVCVGDEGGSQAVHHKENSVTKRKGVLL